jgi:site-specific DNA-methyltransferase (adenine-specific)
LRTTGSLYLHCDPTASHYLKMLLDSIFGPKNFLGEIIWRRTASHTSSRRWPRLHDVLLHFAKDAAHVRFTPARTTPGGCPDRRGSSVAVRC